jgi:hypothetical protein
MLFDVLCTVRCVPALGVFVVVLSFSETRACKMVCNVYTRTPSSTLCFEHLVYACV